MDEPFFLRPKIQDERRGPVTETAAHRDRRDPGNRRAQPPDNTNTPLRGQSNEMPGTNVGCLRTRAEVEYELIGRANF